MSYNSESTFNKENLDLYLKALGKEFRLLYALYIYRGKRICQKRKRLLCVTRYDIL